MPPGEASRRGRHLLALPRRGLTRRALRLRGRSLETMMTARATHQNVSRASSYAVLACQTNWGVRPTTAAQTGASRDPVRLAHHNRGRQQQYYQELQEAARRWLRQKVPRKSEKFCCPRLSHLGMSGVGLHLDVAGRRPQCRQPGLGVECVILDLWAGSPDRLPNCTDDKDAERCCTDWRGRQECYKARRASLAPRPSAGRPKAMDHDPKGDGENGPGPGPRVEPASNAQEEFHYADRAAPECDGRRPGAGANPANPPNEAARETPLARVAPAMRALARFPLADTTRTTAVRPVDPARATTARRPVRERSRITRPREPP